MTPPPPRSKRTNTLLPYPTLFRSIAVTNLDEVVRIIRGSPSPVAAREALLAREWPVAEIAPFIRLVEAIEHEVEGETYKLSDLQVRAILDRSEEHTSELQSLMRISYAVFCLKKKKKQKTHSH